ncbi:MAG: hypothetical protein EWV56_11715 [Microcystis aeruginosa Ma_QC_C_20070823_S13D]|nr:MAG: hypothetical protein EWV56_11715 [Microcystis aeruginosa Ma_QC_C_20070823_S13D]
MIRSKSRLAYNQDLGVIDFQISESNQDLQALTSNIIPKQVEELEKKNQALVAVKTAWEANKQAVTVADKALGDFLTDYAFLKTQDYSSKFLQDTVNSLNQKISNLQTNLTSLKNSNGSNSEILALEKVILEKQKIVGEVQDYQKTVLAGEVEFKQELETRKATSADHLASVKVALGNNDIEGYVTLSSQLANQLKGLTTVWVDDLQDNHNLTIKVWNGLQAESQAFDSLTSYIDENLATPYGDYYLNEIQLDEALQIQESTVRRRDALADSVNFVTDALFLAKKQLQEYQNLAKLGQHYSDLTSLEKQYTQLTAAYSKLEEIKKYTFDIANYSSNFKGGADAIKNDLFDKIDDLESSIKKIGLLSSDQLNSIGSYLQSAKQTITTKTSEIGKLLNFERGLYFDGNDTVSNSATFSNISNTFTIEFWVQPTATRATTPQRNWGIYTSGQRFAVVPNHGHSIAGPGHAGVGVSVGTNGVSVFGHSENYLTSTLVYDANLSGWNHIAIVYNDRTPSLYINGQFIKQGLTSPYTVHPSANLGNLYSSNFYGSMDELRIWNTARTQQQIQDNYYKALSGNEVGLAGYWNFNEATGVMLDDYSNANNIANINGADRTFGLAGQASNINPIGTINFDSIKSLYLDDLGKSVRPKLISNLNEELTNKAQDLVVQIDLTNDQQEQWLETNLQKYIEQKRDGFTNTLKIPLPVDGYSSFNFIHQPQGLTALFWGNENNSEQLIGDFNGDKKDDIVNLQSDGNNWLALSKGDGSFNFTRPPQGLTALFWGDENNSEQLIGDFNGDEKDDIVSLQR